MSPYFGLGFTEFSFNKHPRGDSKAFVQCSPEHCLCSRIGLRPVSYGHAGGHNLFHQVPDTLYRLAFNQPAECDIAVFLEDTPPLSGQSSLFIDLIGRPMSPTFVSRLVAGLAVWSSSASSPLISRRRPSGAPMYPTTGLSEHCSLW